MNIVLNYNDVSLNEINDLIRIYGFEFIHSSDKFGLTPLLRVTLAGRLDIIKLLLNYSANLKDKTKYGETILQMAVENGSEKLIRFLLYKGVDITEKVPFTAFVSKFPRAFIDSIDEVITFFENHNCRDVAKHFSDYKMRLGHEKDVKGSIIDYAKEIKSPQNLIRFLETAMKLRKKYQDLLDSKLDSKNKSIIFEKKLNKR